MNHPARISLSLLVLASLLITSTVRADDKKKDYNKKMYEWQQQQQQLQQQWKLQEIQRQQQLLKQQQSNQRNRAVAIAGRPWGVSQNGRGWLTFTGAAPDRLNSVVVTLNNFFDARGYTNNAGTATVTFYGNYSYPLRGRWTMQGNLTVGLDLTPAANAVRGDEATGNLTMTPPNGASIGRITLTGVMGGNPFTANFTGQ